MPIIRTTSKVRSVSIAVSTGQDSNLSYTARGILLYLLTKPDDWEVDMEDLARQTPKEKVLAIRKAVKELTDAGYLTRTMKKNNTGLICGWTSSVYEVPQNDEAKLKAVVDSLIQWTDSTDDTNTKKIPTPKLYSDLCQSFSIDTGRTLAAMSYSDFLKTAYWDVVRRYKILKSRKHCELCSATGVLHVHHKTYENHGWEHSNLQDLITLCEDCHARHHGKIA